MGKTSTKAKRTYNDKKYRKVFAELEADLVEAWEVKLKEDNLGKAQFIRQSIKKYLEDKNEKNIRL